MDGPFPNLNYLKLTPISIYLTYLDYTSCYLLNLFRSTWRWRWKFKFCLFLIDSYMDSYVLRPFESFYLLFCILFCTFLCFSVIFNVFQCFSVLFCAFLYFYVYFSLLLCVFMSFYVFLCTFMCFYVCFYVLLCTFMLFYKNTEKHWKVDKNRT